MNLLVSWKFIISCKLFVAALSKFNFLSPLIFPLTTIICAAIKTKLNSIIYSPFVCHLLNLLCNLSCSTEKYIPIASYIFYLADSIFKHMDVVSHKNFRIAHANIGKKKNLNIDLNTTKMKDVQIILKIHENDLNSLPALESILEEIRFIVINEIGIMCRHPSYPEISNIFMLNIHKLIKNCRNGTIRGEWKKIMEKSKTTTDIIKEKRYYLNINDIHINHFLFFPVNILPLALYREKVLKEREEFIKLKVISAIKNIETRTKGNAEESLGKKEQKKLRQKIKKQKIINEKVDENKTKQEDIPKITTQISLAEDIVEQLVLSSDSEE